MKKSLDATERAIGVFDSGIGGLTVLKEIHKILPKENIIYLGDTARVPYGIRSPETVKKYSLENSAFLIEKGIKLLVIACNTASAVSLDLLSRFFTIPIIGVIKPGARAAVRTTKTKKIGVIGTEATIRSHAYRREIQKLDDTIEVKAKSCPLFVPLVEEGWLDDEVAEMTAWKYLTEMKEYKPDTLVLGCTHYPLLKKVISKVMNGDTVLIDSAIETAQMVKEVLTELQLTCTATTHSTREYYVTDSPERFAGIGKRFLDEPLDNIKAIDIKALETTI